MERKKSTKNRCKKGKTGPETGRIKRANRKKYHQKGLTKNNNPKTGHQKVDTKMTKTALPFFRIKLISLIWLRNGSRGRKTVRRLGPNAFLDLILIF